MHLQPLLAPWCSVPGHMVLVGSPGHCSRSWEGPQGAGPDSPSQLRLHPEPQKRAGPGLGHTAWDIHSSANLVQVLLLTRQIVSLFCPSVHLTDGEVEVQSGQGLLGSPRQQQGRQGRS